MTIELNKDTNELTAEQKHIVMVDSVKSALKTGGLDQFKQKMKISDAMAYPDSHLVFEKAIQEIVQEVIEPDLIGHMLVNVVNDLGGTANQIQIRTIGPLADFDFYVPEGGEFKEIGAGNAQTEILTATYGKYGVKVKFTQEMLEGSQWNLMSLWLRQAAAALARNRDKAIIDMLFNKGRVIFDNADPDSAEIGLTTGRDIAGVGNGSMTVNDLIDMYSRLLESGYTPNVVLVHPLAWAMFAKDPIMRESGMIRGNITQWLNRQVSPVNPYTALPNYQLNRPFDRYELDNKELEEVLKTTPDIPSYSPLTGLTVIPTALLPYDAVNRTATVMMMDTRNTGTLIFREYMTAEGWDEPQRDIKAVKLRERWALEIHDEGRAIVVARNISLDSNELFVNPQAVITNLAPINQKP